MRLCPGEHDGRVHPPVHVAWESARRLPSFGVIVCAGGKVGACLPAPGHDLCTAQRRWAITMVPKPTHPACAQVYYFPRGRGVAGRPPGLVCGAGGGGRGDLVHVSTLMFTALGCFYNRISDPDMGGAYLTLLNTIANMGARAHEVWPIEQN